MAGANGPSALHAGFATHNSAFARLATTDSNILHRKHSAISKIHLNHRASKVVDFSIDGILGKRSRETDEEDEEEEQGKEDDANIGSQSNVPGNVSEIDKSSVSIEKSNKSALEHDNPLARFSWLQCTRYKPPRLPSKHLQFFRFGGILFVYVTIVFTKISADKSLSNRLI